MWQTRFSTDLPREVLVSVTWEKIGWDELSRGVTITADEWNA